MTEASEGQRATGVASAGSRPAPTSDDAVSAGGTTSAAAASAGGTPGPGKAVAGTSATGTSASVLSASGTSDSGTAPADVATGPSKAVVGPFTLRELVFGGGVALVFLGTLLPFIGGRVLYTNFWSSASLFFIGIGILLPVVALALVAARRLGSSGLRVGSLSVDQFASVTAVLAATFFFLQTVTAYHVGPLVALVGSLGMLAATVVGPFLPVLKDDFTDRPEIPALPAARPITAARPRPPKPAKPAAEVEAGPAPSSSRTNSSSPAGVNPAAAGVRQNGAGLYGAGGAGAVGAGAAAAGQSGMERSSSTPSSTGTAARDAGQVGAHAVGSTSADTDGPQDGSARSDTARVGETRVHDVVNDGTRTFTAADSSKAPGGSSGDSSSTSSSDSSGEERGRQEPITATRSADEEPVVEAFWFAVGSQRPVYDEQNGREIFKLQPGDWEVGIEDRGSEFLVQDKRTGAVGILRDLRNIERAPRD
ncbi:PrgI family protein [Arthrobacter sp. MDT1-65]